MFLDNRNYGICETTNNFSQMGSGYAQFFRVFCFLIFICIFPLAITGALNTFRNLTGDDCYTIEKVKELEDSITLPKEYQSFISTFESKKKLRRILEFGETDNDVMENLNMGAIGDFGTDKAGIPTVGKDDNKGKINKN